MSKHKLKVLGARYKQKIKATFLISLPFSYEAHDNQFIPPRGKFEKKVNHTSCTSKAELVQLIEKNNDLWKVHKRQFHQC
jgi:hypothetical protein